MERLVGGAAGAGRPSGRPGERADGDPAAAAAESGDGVSAGGGGVMVGVYGLDLVMRPSTVVEHLRIGMIDGLGG